MLKLIDSFKSINFYYKNNDNLYSVQCYKILNTRDLNSKSKQKIINKFKPTGIIYKHKTLKGYYHELKNLFIFNNQLVLIKHIKYPQLFKTFIEHYNDFRNIVISFDLIPVFIELYDKHTNIHKIIKQIYLNKLRLTMHVNNISFKDYNVYYKLIQKAKKERCSKITVDKNIKYIVLLENQDKIKQIDLQIDLNIWQMYKLLNYVY